MMSDSQLAGLDPLLARAYGDLADMVRYHPCDCGPLLDRALTARREVAA